jgi:hypothetical protein
MRPEIGTCASERIVARAKPEMGMRTHVEEAQDARRPHRDVRVEKDSDAREIGHRDERVASNRSFMARASTTILARESGAILTRARARAS